MIAGKSIYQVLYRTRPAWEVGETGEHYPGDYAGIVISVMKADHAWGPGDLKDPARQVATLDLTDDEASKLRGRVSKMLERQPLPVTFDDRWGAVAVALAALTCIEGSERFEMEADMLMRDLPMGKKRG